MRILLIYPPITTYGPAAVGPHPPLGLAYIAAFLEQNNYEVRILDALALGGDNVQTNGNYNRFGLSEVNITNYVRDFAPDIVGISVMFTAFVNDAYDVARVVKEVCPTTTVVFGGAHASINPEAVLEDKNVDIAVQGEGEATFLELVKTLETKRDISEVTGVTFKKGGKILSNSPRPLIADLDSLPFPARHLLPMEAYNKSDSLFTMRQPLTSMITSRGCPRDCCFCSIHSVWGHSWRGRGAKSVVDELEHLTQAYSIREVHFLDDNISLNKKRMTEICDAIIDRKIDIRWTPPNGIAIWTLDRELLKKIKRSGCYRLTFGIESGNPETQKFIGKKLDRERVKEVIRNANSLGLWTLCTFIIGFPYETREAIYDTIDFAIDSGTDLALFYRLGLWPGIPVYEIFRKEALLPEDDSQAYSELAACDTKFLKGEELYELQRKAYKSFLTRRLFSFLNPLRLKRKIRSVEDLRYVLGLATIVPGMLLNMIKTKRGVSSQVLRG